ncbi:hypothetical protein IscW_ISCW007596 [Ixodes scapularis]|uniref:Uncharacterized protein n=1 Tax=Ixodes scapularis TaxID=6945 RepID=B7PUV5_IXOSC|nr:hypothetical protein IscW_ISCW007596 [Ixodes scapularis]|eukprot:XP_002406869.1 hypothetical protein IscW_ISCW007596 [Ixodes scapularis]
MRVSEVDVKEDEDVDVVDVDADVRRASEDSVESLARDDDAWLEDLDDADVDTRLWDRSSGESA